MSLEELKIVACDTIENNKKALYSLSNSIWSNPELCFEEHHAHDICCSFMEQHGMETERHFNLDTAFRAVYGTAEKGEPCVMLIAEYDALPDIGHACGHNLIAEIALGAGIGLKAAMEASERNIGKVIVLGTPAEEGGGGKVPLIKAGIFDDVTVAMMSHPSARKPQIHIPGFLASKKLKVTYKGKASHAAASPWSGVNALDAVVMAYNNISCMRQQIKPEWRVHGIISKGGSKPNIIPEETEALFYIRAPTMKALQELEGKVRACFEGAATAAGCQVVIDYTSHPYENVLTNGTLASLYDKNASSLGIDICRDWSEIPKASASTDMGNVSHVVPSIHPLFQIPSAGCNHTRAFNEAAGSVTAQRPTLDQAKALAMTGLDIFLNFDYIAKIRKDFQDDLRKDASL